jgi:hypothetical protein
MFAAIFSQEFQGGGDETLLELEIAGPETL